jgi:hypothetical protein
MTHRKYVAKEVSKRKVQLTACFAFNKILQNTSYTGEPSFKIYELKI